MASNLHSVCLLTAVLALGTTTSAQLPPDPTPPGKQEPAKTPPPPESPEDVIDEVFVAQVIRNGRAETELSKIALTKSVRPEVKILAQRVVDDHAKIQAELSVIANAKKMILPPDPEPKDKAALEQMDKLTGEAFDRMYVTRMIADHSRALETFKEYTEKGVDVAVKAWAARAVPSLQLRLDLGREVEKKLES